MTRGAPECSPAPEPHSPLVTSHGGVSGRGFVWLFLYFIDCTRSR